MGKISRQTKPPRIPAPVGEIQVNGCRNPTCQNFLALSPIANADDETGALERAGKRGGPFHISGKDQWTSQLFCSACEARRAAGESVSVVSSTLKSNRAVHEELRRLSRYLDASIGRCPNPSCVCNISNTSPSVKKNGKTSSGNQRLQCRLCGTNFSLFHKTQPQKYPHINKNVFKSLVYKMPFKRIMRFYEIHPEVAYDRVKFIYKQCMAFAANRESKLHKKNFQRIYLCTDRQVLISNWKVRKDKRNCEIYGIATACSKTDYVFGFHFNFDGELDAEEVEKLAVECGDYTTKKHHRKYSRIWLKEEFDERTRSKRSKKGRPSAGSLIDDVEIKTSVDQALDVDDSSEYFDMNNQLPAKGVLIHNEYTMMAHFFFLKERLKGADKTRFYLDLDSGMKAAYVAAFREEIAEGCSDGFSVRATKDMTNDERERRVREFKKRISHISGVPVNQLTYQITRDAINELIIESMHNPISFSGKEELWIEHPEATKPEPEKMVSAITNIQRYDEVHQANLYRKATLAPVDRFFMRIRRSSTFFERPFSSGTNQGRIWNGYSAYNPVMYQMIGEIFRVYYNYCTDDRKEKPVTPAMRMGLADNPVEIEKIIYYKKHKN